MKTYTLKIQPNETFYLRGVPGDYVRVKTSSVELKIETVESQGRDSVEVSQGDDFNFSPFQTLMISHSDAAEQVVKLMISTGKKASSSPVSNQVTVAGTPTVNVVSMTGGAFNQNRTQVTNVSKPILPARAGRKYLFVQNNDASVTLRLSLVGSNATATVGVRLAPGESIELMGVCPSAIIYGMMEVATSQNSNVEFMDM